MRTLPVQPQLLDRRFDERAHSMRASVGHQPQVTKRLVGRQSELCTLLWGSV